MYLLIERDNDFIIFGPLNLGYSEGFFSFFYRVFSLLSFFFFIFNTYFL